MSCDREEIQWSCVDEDSTFTVMARVEKPDDTTPAVPDDVESVTISLYDITTGDDIQVGEDATPDVADVMYETLQTSNIWKRDSQGFNWKWKSIVADADHLYRLDALLVFANGDQRKIKWHLKSR